MLGSYARFLSDFIIMNPINIKKDNKNITISYDQKIQPYHPLIAKLANENATNNQRRVLDIGCGTGNTLIELAKINNQFKFYITDVDAECLRITKERVPVEESYLTGKPDAVVTDGKTYDIILMSHILQYDPMAADTVQKLLSQLNSDGFIIIAISNVVTPTKILNNLRKRQYSEGIYTWDRSTFHNFIKASGGEVIEWAYDYVPLPMLNKISIFKKIAIQLAKIIPWLSFSVIAVIKVPELKSDQNTKKNAVND